MTKKVITIVAATAALTVGASAGSAQETVTEKVTPTITTIAPESWDYTLTLWGWLPKIEGDTVPGPTLKLSVSDILDNLSFVAFGAFQADKGDLSLQTDGLYMKLNGNASDRLDVQMQAVVFNAGAAYSIYKNQTTNLSAYGGARYLWIKNDFDFDGRFLNFETSFKDDVIDGVIGFRGRTEINDKWYATYFADVGAGQSDLVWQAGAMMNYRFEKFDAFFGYRHMYWNFDGSLVGLKNLEVTGPVVGARFEF